MLAFFNCAYATKFKFNLNLNYHKSRIKDILHLNIHLGEKMSRTRRSDGDVTKTKILEAAGQLIAQLGWAQTSNKEIVKLAEVDLAAINYHFGGRDGLYQAVLSEAHAHYLNEQELQAIADLQCDPEEKLGIFFETLVVKLVEHDVWHGKVFIREIFSPSAHLLNFFETEGMRKFQIIRRIMSQITSLDENDPTLLPCIFSVVAPCLMLIMTSLAVPGPLQSMRYIPAKQLAQHFKTFSLAGLKAVVEAQKQSIPH